MTRRRSPLGPTRARSVLLRRFLGERGAALVEFIIVLPLLLLLLLGIIEFGWWIHVTNVVDQSARAGARRIAIDGATSPDAARAAASVITASGLRAENTTLRAQVPRAVVGPIPATRPGNMSFRCVYPSATTSRTQTIEFTTTYRYRPLFPMLNSRLFFGGLGRVIGDRTSSVVLPSEVQWVRGTGPVLNNGVQSLCR